MTVSDEGYRKNCYTRQSDDNIPLARMKWILVSNHLQKDDSFETRIKAEFRENSTFWMVEFSYIHAGILRIQAQLLSVSVKVKEVVSWAAHAREIAVKIALPVSRLNSVLLKKGSLGNTRLILPANMLLVPVSISLASRLCSGGF